MTIRAFDNMIQTVNLGKQGENKARQIVFDISDFREHYGPGTAMLVHKRQRDAAPYIVDTAVSGNMLIWNISSTDTEQAGAGCAELRYVVNDVLAKSIIFRTAVIPSITGDTVIPPALQSWYDAMIAYINGFDVSPETVAQAVEAYFSENPVSVPVNTSDLNNDAGFITSADIPAIPAASSDSPQMDGTASPGSSAAFSRSDHVHPSDDTKVDKILGKGLSTCDYTNEDRIKLSGVASGAEVNTITAIEKNGYPVSPDSNRHVNITVPTKVSDLTNDSDFATNTEVWTAIEYAANELILDCADLTKNAAQGQCYGTCDTAAATAAKTVSFSGYHLSNGGIVAVKFTYAVPASATLNINSNGAKAIYFRGAAITADVINAGDTATMIYDGTYYQLIAVDRWHTDIADLATQLNALVDGDEVNY